MEELVKNYPTLSLIGAGLAGSGSVLLGLAKLGWLKTKEVTSLESTNQPEIKTPGYCGTDRRGYVERLECQKFQENIKTDINHRLDRIEDRAEERTVRLHEGQEAVRKELSDKMDKITKLIKK